MVTQEARGIVSCYEAYKPGKQLPIRLNHLSSFAPQSVTSEETSSLHHPLRREPWYRRTNLTGYVYRGAVLTVST